MTKKWETPEIISLTYKNAAGTKQTNRSSEGTFGGTGPKSGLTGNQS